MKGDLQGSRAGTGACVSNDETYCEFGTPTFGVEHCPVLMIRRAYLDFGIQQAADHQQSPTNALATVLLPIPTDHATLIR